MIDEYEYYYTVDSDNECELRVKGTYHEIKELEGCIREHTKLMNELVRETKDGPNHDDMNHYDMVNRPQHYTSNNVETIEKIERFIEGLPSKQAHLIGSALKYFDRAGLKDNFDQDCAKGNNYLHRAITGKWKHE